MLGLEVTGALGAGSEGMARRSITNRLETTASYIRIELVVSGWVEPIPPQAGDRKVSMTAMEDGATRFGYRMDTTPSHAGGYE